MTEGELVSALNVEIRRLPKWKFARLRVTSWLLGYPNPSIDNGRARARVVPILTGDCDGCGSYIWAMVEDGDTPQAVAARMVDRLLADPAFETSAGTPVG